MTIRTAGLCVATLSLLLCAAATDRALAADGLVINEQIQLGDVFSHQTLNVEEAPEGVGVSTTAVGDIVAATGRNSMIDFQNAQTLGGRVEAASDVRVAGATGDYFATDTSATGNSATAGTCCALTLGTSDQRVEAGAVVAADAYSRTGGPADSISVDVSAVGNTQGWNQVNGEVDTFTAQTNAGRTSATNTGDFTASPGNVGLTATAVANNVTGDIDGAPLDIGVEQGRWGPGASAVVDARVGVGEDIQAIATASGNLADVQAVSSTAAMSVAQTGEAGLDAYANLDIGQWAGGANAVAYGVGNSVVLSNVGAETSLYTEQGSGGEVNATASFTGGTGGAAFANAAAIGNAVSGFACEECGGSLGGFNRQVNGARVQSQSNVTISGRSGPVSADASAVGNTATYRVFSNGSGD